MPTYRVTDSVSGVTLDLTGDSPPNEQELQDIFRGYKPPEAPKTEEQSALRQVADVPLQFGTGVAQGVRFITDAFGADNAVSENIRGVEDYLSNLLSAQAKQDQQEVARIFQDAQDKGLGEQLGAGLRALAVSPVDFLAQGLGTAVPTIAGGLAGAALKGGTLAARAATASAVGTGIGTVGGAGITKSTIYDEVKRELEAAGVDPETADERAKLAQEYGGENLDQILLGAGLGGLAAGTGLEKVLASRILKNAGIVPKSIKTAAFAGAKEAAPEFIQAAQEQIAGNVALQREGFEDIPTLRGVASAAALEGSLGFLLGAGVDVALPAQQQQEYDAARANITNEVDRQREAALREQETIDAQKFIAALNAENKRRQQGQADQVNLDAEAAKIRARAGEIAPPIQDEVNTLATPMRGPDVSNDVQFGVAYGQKIARELGDYFPNFGQFSVTQGETIRNEAGETQPTFTIIDSEGKRYGQPLTTFEQANATAYSLNKEVLNQNVRGAILNSLETSSQAYDPETTQRLFSYGYRTLNPDANTFSTVAINEAAKTVGPQYAEALSWRQVEALPEVKDRRGRRIGYQYTIDGQPPRTIIGLTKAQELNKMRSQEGKPESNTFSLQETKSALGKSFAAITKDVPIDPKIGKQGAINQIKSVLQSKNVISEIDSPEVNALAKGLTGKSSVNDMDYGDIRLFYKKLADLPRFENETRLPEFTFKPYNRENFVKASKFIQQSNAQGVKPTQDQIIEAAGISKDDPKIDEKITALQADLSKQGVKNEPKPVLALPAPPGGTIDLEPLRKALRANLKGFGLQDVGLSLERNLIKPTGEIVQEGTEGMFIPAMRQVFLAVDRIDPDGSLTPEQRLNALSEIMDHEVIHATRLMDLWKPNEWSNLERTIAKIKKPGTDQSYLQIAQQGYADQNAVVQIEEAVADMWRDYRAKRLKVAGKPQNLLERLAQFFQRLRSALAGTGFQTYGEILNRLETGELGARERGEIRTLRATEEAVARAGRLPERLQGILGAPAPRAAARAAAVAPAAPVAPATPAAPAPAAPTATRPQDFDVGLLAGADVRESRVRNPQIDTPQFQRFIKDSKAVDESGEPQVFYHGTTRDIDVFRPKPGHKLIFISPDPNFASRYAANNMLFFQPPRDMQDVDWAERQIANAQFGDQTRSPAIYPIYVNAKNPFDFQNKSHIAQLEKDLPKILSKSTPSRGAYTKAEIRKAIDEIKKGRWAYIEDVAENTDFFERSGYDSIYVEEAGVRNLAVFSPNQLKSAVGNVGTFDITRPSIRESRVPREKTLEELEAEIAALDAAEAAERETVSEVESFARRSAQFAFDFQKDYSDLQDSIDSSRDNVRETLKENPFGPNSTRYEEQAFSAYDAEVERLRQKGRAAPSIRESRRLQTTPIQSALDLARRKYADYSTASEEEFFGRFWPTLLSTVRGTVAPTNSNIRTAAKRAIRDMDQWLKDNPRFRDYYNNDMAATKRVLESAYGPLSDEDFLYYRIANGLTSPATKLPSNVGDALLVFDLWKNRGNLDDIKMGLSAKGNVVIDESPISISGTTGANKARSLKIIDRLIREKGSINNAVNFLKEGVTVKDLHAFNREMGYKGNASDIGAIQDLVEMATGQRDLIPRMFIFGKKVGAYTLNMAGDSRYNTIDVWESRFIRSYFDGLFSERTGLPEVVSEDQLFQDFTKLFKEEFEKATNQKWDNSALQAMRWFYILNAASKAGYRGASTNETISEYTRRSLQSPRKGRAYRRGTGDAATERAGTVIRESRMGSQRTGVGRGRAEGRSLAPLEGAPTVEGASGPDPRLVSVAEDYARKAGIPYTRQPRYVEVDEGRAKRIADAYEAMQHSPNNPAVKQAYDDLMRQVMDQYNSLVDAGYTFTFFDSKTDPYAGNPWNAMRDLRQNQRMAVYGTYDGFGTEGLTTGAVQNNPLLADTGLRWPDQNGDEQIVTGNDLFRAVHDAFGHGLEGAGFRARGEENAWQAHARLFTGPGLGALTSETRGQNSWLNYGPYGERNRNAKVEDTVFAEQKTGLMPEWTWQEGLDVAPTVEPISREAPRPQAQLDDAVAKAEADVASTPTMAVPLYNPGASPEALYVAQNPDQGLKLTPEENIRYSRRNQPQYQPGVEQILNKLTQDPPAQTPAQTVINSMRLPPFRDTIDKIRQNLIFNYSRLEFYRKNHPSLMHQTAATGSLEAAEFADRSKAIFASAVRSGVPVYENGGFTVKPFVHNGREYKNGLIDVLAPLYNNPYGVSLERLAQAYAIARRGERLTREGKVVPGDPADFPQLLAEVRRYTNPETGNSIIEDWFDTWQAYNSNTIKFLRDTGMIDDAGAQLWLNQSDYFPFYRTDKTGKDISHPRVFGGLTSATNLKALKGGEEAINVPLMEAILTNLDSAIAMGMKNVAQQRIVRDMINIGLGRMVQPGQNIEGQPAVTFKIGGKKYAAFIDDPLVFQSMQTVPEVEMDGLLGNLFRTPAVVLRELITREPGYMVANMLRDTASAALTTGANIIPVVDTVRNFSRGLENLQKVGVVGGYDFARDPKDIVKFISDEARRVGHEFPVREETKWDQFVNSRYLRPLTGAWDMLGRISDKSEASTRNAVYEDTLARTGDWVQAAYDALSVINYGRRGRNPQLRLITATVPFLNARIQGLDKLYQAATGQTGAFPERRKNILRFVTRAGLMVGLTGLYYAMISDDELYENENPEVRDNYYILPIKKADLANKEPGFAVKIPIPFEVGVLFKTIPERIMDSYYKDAPAKDLQNTLTRAATSTFAFNPIPQTVLPIFEVVANYDFFTGRAIVPQYMQNRDAIAQARFGTNELARMLGEATGISPLKLDHMMNGYLGSLGTYTLDVVDNVLRDNDRAYPERKWFEYPFVRRFFTTAMRPGLQEQFYELDNRVNGVVQSMNALKKEGRADELQAYVMENQNILALKKGVSVLDKMVSNYRDQKNAILRMDIDPEEKRRIIDELDRGIALQLKVIPELRRLAYREPDETRE